MKSTHKHTRAANLKCYLEKKIPSAKMRDKKDAEITTATPRCFCHTDDRRIWLCVCACRHICQRASWEGLCVCAIAEGRVGDLLWSGPGRHQHSIIPDLPDDTSRENTLPVSCRLAFFCCLLFIIFRAASPQGQVTICILFLQVFSKLSRVVVFFFFLLFHFSAFFFYLSVKGGAVDGF